MDSYSRRYLEKTIYTGEQTPQEKEVWPQNYSRMEIIKEHTYDPVKGPIYSLQFTHDGNRLAVGFGNGGIEIYHALSGDLLCVVRESRYGGMQIMCLRFHPKHNHILLATTSDGKIFQCILNISDDSVTVVSVSEIISEKGNEINCLDFCEDGLTFATGGKDLTVRVYDGKTNMLISSFGNKVDNDSKVSDCYQSASSASSVTMRVWAIKYRPDDPDIFLTGGWDNDIKIWDARSGGVRRTIYGPHICGDGLDIRKFEVLTGSWKNHNALQIWNYSEDYGPTSKAKPREIPFGDTGNGEYLYCAQFCNKNTVMAGGSGTNSCKAINIDTGKVIGEIKFKKAVISMDTAFGGQRFAVGSEECRLVIGGLRE